MTEDDENRCGGMWRSMPPLSCRTGCGAEYQGLRDPGYAGRWLAPVTEDDENRRSSGFTGPRRAGALLWLRNPSYPARSCKSFQQPQHQVRMQARVHAGSAGLLNAWGRCRQYWCCAPFSAFPCGLAVAM